MKLLATLALTGALALGLAGCNIGGTSVNINTADVITASKAACQFVPTAATVEAELKANPTITQATAIAALICQAVSSVNVAPSSAAATSSTDKEWAQVVVNGQTIPVVGHFVAK